MNSFSPLKEKSLWATAYSELIEEPFPFKSNESFLEQLMER